MITNKAMNGDGYYIVSLTRGKHSMELRLQKSVVDDAPVAAVHQVIMSALKECALLTIDLEV